MCFDGFPGGLVFHQVFSRVPCLEFFRGRVWSMVVVKILQKKKGSNTTTTVFFNS